MSNLPLTTDFLIIGGGVMGVTLALAIRQRFSDVSITLIEKEQQCGLHASGRNSGVLHAGFYYTAESLKARFTREGNQAWTAYCLERQLPINQCGKLVVARNENEVTVLQKLLHRGNKNGVEVVLVSEADAREIEPRVKTRHQALFSPTTASVDPVLLMQSIVADAQKAGIGIFTSTAYLGHDKQKIRTSRGLIQCGYVINVAGLHADRIAHDFGFANNVTMLPFKGLYLHSSEPPGSFTTHIYPVPDLANPFLGVHITLAANQSVHIGPTAIPALWREHYRGISQFKLKDFLKIGQQEASLLLHNDFGFRQLALSEIKKYRKKKLVEMASQLATGIKPEHFKTWGKPGIRAQLLDTRKRKLVSDFLYEADDRSFHLLNAVSPAFTCAWPFSHWLCGEIQNLINY